MIITQEVVDSIKRKNGRARKRMIRRCMRKAFRYNCDMVGVKAAQNKPYTLLELELNRIADAWPAKLLRMMKKRYLDIEKSMNVQYPCDF